MIEVVKQSFEERVNMYMSSEVEDLATMYNARLKFHGNKDIPSVEDVRKEYGFSKDMSRKEYAIVLAKHEVWFSPNGCSEV